MFKTSIKKEVFRSLRARFKMAQKVYDESLKSLNEETRLKKADACVEYQNKLENIEVAHKFSKENLLATTVKDIISKII